MIWSLIKPAKVTPFVSALKAPQATFSMNNKRTKKTLKALPAGAPEVSRA
jgi:hypothetical protein